MKKIIQSPSQPVSQSSYLWLEHRHGAVVIAMVAVGMVQAPVHKVVEMVAVGHLLVPAALVATLAGKWRAVGRVLGANRDHVLVVVPGVLGVQMPVVQEVNVVSVLDAGMPAVGAMDVLVIGVGLVAHVVPHSSYCALAARSPFRSPALPVQ
jgi:hypothetical protein